MKMAICHRDGNPWRVACFAVLLNSCCTSVHRPRTVSAQLHAMLASTSGRSVCLGNRRRSGVNAPVVRVCRGISAARDQARAPGHQQRLRPVQAAFDINDIPKEFLLAGGAAAAALVGLIGYGVSQQQPGSDMGGADSSQAGEAPAAPAPPPRENAVLVFGATGRMGRLVVQELLKAGRTVVAAVRSADKAADVYGGLGLKEGYQGPGRSGGILFTAPGVDVSDAGTLTADLFKGVTQVVSLLGPVAGRLPDGSFGYIDGMSPERVEQQGMANIVAAMAAHMTRANPSSATVLPMATSGDLGAWERMDDVIMGGNSSSGLEPAADGSGAVWKGDLIVEGGGFCGARTRKLDLNLAAYDGLRLRVKGDGQTFKFNIKTLDQEDTPESTYQATFDTSPDGDWTTVHLPWHDFVPVKRAQSDPKGAPLDPSRISKFGLVLSRFEFNKMPNPSYKPGPFALEIAGGIGAFTAPRPQLLVVGSAGVERNAIIGDDAEARKKDIPIIQLNPGGVLNYKYDAEVKARASGFPYCVVRCTGLDDKGDEPPCLLEADQGDTISGRVLRADAAALIVHALATPDAARKTFELRRSEAADAKGKAMTPAAYTRLFLKLAPDSHRWRVGLQPFPAWVPPPPPPDTTRTQEILNDPRVAAVRERDNARREQEAKEREEREQRAKAEKEVVTTNA